MVATSGAQRRTAARPRAIQVRKTWRAPVGSPSPTTRSPPAGSQTAPAPAARLHSHIRFTIAEVLPAPAGREGSTQAVAELRAVNDAFFGCGYRRQSSTWTRTRGESSRRRTRSNLGGRAELARPKSAVITGGAHQAAGRRHFLNKPFCEPSWHPICFSHPQAHRALGSGHRHIIWWLGCRAFRAWHGSDPIPGTTFLGDCLRSGAAGGTSSAAGQPHGHSRCLTTRFARSGRPRHRTRHRPREGRIDQIGTSTGGSYARESGPLAPRHGQALRRLPRVPRSPARWLGRTDPFSRTPEPAEGRGEIRARRRRGMTIGLGTAVRSRVRL